MSSQIPVACRDCEREGHQLRICRIKYLNFNAFNKKCPRELALAEPTPTTTIPVVKEEVLSVTSDKIMVSNIPIDNLELGVFSPRMRFDPNYIAKLAEDIEAEGQLKPIVVRSHPSQAEKYQVIDGEHRVRALQKLGKALVRAEVHVLSDEEAYHRAMRINQLHGKRLEELEEARHINKMMAVFGYTEMEMAKRLDRPQSWISQRRSLAVKIAPKVEEKIISRLITPSHAIEIAELPKEDQEKVVEKVAEKRLRRSATRGLVHAIKEATPEKKQQILEKPLEVYAKEFKDPATLKKALLTISPQDDFLKKAEEIKTAEQAKKFWEGAKPQEALETLECPGCGRKLRVDWAKGEILWD